ncbi:porin [Pandoraea oxalativorans]|uniref:Porin domain-containing protein n=1 Tax=Pandoraea oxalativorans TaxID=573737 RepID=A0A0E3U636_9BURK|nr:porin [Pandoraea oxalativorans]AKC69138.1 hypothetical protein MB84_06140 [Pandoraea oxalativorans]
MKFRLAMAAGLALLTTTANAQSNVTLYGIIDTGVVYYNQAAAGGSFVGVPTLTGELPSRFGLRGVEDLGGGLKAVFTLENGFQPGTGSLNYGGRLFGRQANVGLAGEWGTVLIGRQNNMSFFATLNADIIGPSNMSMASFDPYLANTRSDNAVSYMGKFHGVTLGATYSFGRDTANAGGPSATGCPGQVAGNFRACKQYTGLIGYDYQDFGIAASYDQMRGNVGAAAPLTSAAYTDSRGIVNAYYKLSWGRVGGGWIHRNVDAGAASLQSDIYFLGATYLPTIEWALDFQALRYQVKSKSNATLLVSRATYSLSKRTSVYGMVGWVGNSENGSVPISAGGSVVTGANQFGTMLGMQHRF